MTPAKDQIALRDDLATRRYFAKFRAITGHLARVATLMQEEGHLGRIEAEVLTSYGVRLARTFEALSYKYLLTGRDTGRFFGSLSMDSRESGFPLHRELLVMANDALEAERHLKNMPNQARLKEEMIQQIVGALTIPTKLQFALAQRQYFEALQQGQLFWPQNHPQAIWVRSDEQRDRTYLIHWAVFDSDTNLPTVYLMECRDTGRVALPRDERRWPEVQQHLLAQSLAGLKLVTIGQGFDQDFDDLHPMRLRRFHVGPMYSHSFTQQTGPLAQVLETAQAPAGQDWALAWTEEVLESDRAEEERQGWFGKVERQIFRLDPVAARAAELGATAQHRAVILPLRAYQVLAEMDPPGFRGVTQYVVHPTGRVMRVG